MNTMTTDELRVLASYNMIEEVIIFLSDDEQPTAVKVHPQGNTSRWLSTSFPSNINIEYVIRILAGNGLPLGSISLCYDA